MSVINRNTGSAVYDTFADALNANLKVGQLCIAKGQVTATDGIGAQYEVKASGSGGATMANGNELVILAGETLKFPSIADLVPFTRVGQKISVTGYHPSTTVGGGEFVGSNGVHNGVTLIDPSRAFPTPAQWANGSSDPAVIAWYDDTQPAAACWERTESALSVFDAGARKSPHDDTASIQAFINQQLVVPILPGSYLHTGINIPANRLIIGSGEGNTSLDLIDGSNAHCVVLQDVSNVGIARLTIDGNKLNQSIGTGNNWRGIYALGICHNLHIVDVTVTNVVDHGVFLSDGGTPSNETGKNSKIDNVTVTNAGSSAHIGAGGAGGSGFVGGVTSTNYIACYASGNYLNGFKSGGTHIACHSISNIGGGWETGFSTPEATQVKYIACHSKNNGGSGFRNQGQIDEITWEDCEISGNGGSGIIFINSVKKAKIRGGWILNNGQALLGHSDTEGQDGVTLAGTSVNAEDIDIDGVTFYDDQVSKTQYSHVYVHKQTDNVKIGDNCRFGDAATQKLYIAPGALASSIDIGAAKGLATTDKDNTTVTITGTTTETVLRQMTVPAYSINDYNPIKTQSFFSITGTNGTKIIRLKVGPASQVVTNLAAGAEHEISLETSILRKGSAIYVDYVLKQFGGAIAQGGLVVGLSSGSDMNIQITGQLGSALDTINDVYWSANSAPFAN